MLFRSTPDIVPLTLTGNCTITLPTPPATANTVYSIEYWLYQDGTGSRSVTWAATSGLTIAWDNSGTAPAISPSSLALTIVQFRILNGSSKWEGRRVWATRLPVILSWQSNGDANGLFYWLGTAKGTAAWSNPVSGTANPYTGTFVSALQSSILTTNYATYATDRNSSTIVHTDNFSSSWIGWLFSSGFSISGYSIQTRADTNVQMLAQWTLEGTNDAVTADVSSFNGATWTTIDARSITPVQEQWNYYSVSSPGTYSAIRLRQTAANSSGANYLAISEIEFYGTQN